jgi:hypothetical protein
MEPALTPAAPGLADAVGLPQLAADAAAMVSFQTAVPEALLRAMRVFIEDHPNWDQYRLMQAALAGFLVQNGMRSREITRCYLANLFPVQSRFRGR